MTLWADVCENIPERCLKDLNSGVIGGILATHGDPSRRLRRWYAPTLSGAYRRGRSRVSTADSVPVGTSARRRDHWVSGCFG